MNPDIAVYYIFIQLSIYLRLLPTHNGRSRFCVC